LSLTLIALSEILLAMPATTTLGRRKQNEKEKNASQLQAQRARVPRKPCPDLLLTCDPSVFPKLIFRPKQRGPHWPCVSQSHKHPVAGTSIVCTVCLTAVTSQLMQYFNYVKVKVKQSHYRPGRP
jgi:hypothetical protein